MDWPLIKRKVPYVEQLSVTECGICCIAMILRYYRSYESLHDLRQHLETGRDGSSITQLVGLLKKLNFNVKTYKTTVQGLRQLTHPSILYWEDKHFVILERTTDTHAWIVDPAYGRVKITLSELEHSFSNYVIAPIPGESFERKRKGKSIWRKYIPVLLMRKKLFLQIILLSVFSYLFTIALPIYIQNLIDMSTSSPELQKIDLYLLFICLFSLSYIIIDYVKNLRLINLRVFIDKHISSDLFRHLLKLPFKYFDVRNKTDILSSLNSTMVIRETFARQLISGIIDIGAILFILWYMLNQSILMSSFILGIFILNVNIVLLTKPRLIDYNKYLVLQQNKSNSVQIEAVFSIMGIKMSSIENDVYERWQTNFQEYLDKYKYREKFNNYLNSLMNITQVVFPIIILTTGILLVTKNMISLGQAIAFYSLSSTFFSLSSSIFDTWISYLNSRAYLERIGDVVNTEIEEVADNPVQLDLSGHIKMEHVSFSYSKNSQNVINNVSIEIQQGQKVAIVGSSGSGKSTLAKLLVGLYSPTEGDIYFDGISVKKIDKTKLRKQMGIVPQEVTLFNKTIFENIRMHNPAISLEDVIEAVKIAQIYHEIEAMPQKYFTIVSEMGMNLSGGQRQRIALARAIIHKPKIIVLDEATSSLDSINESKVSEYFASIGCTRIIIAHRLSTIVDADHIIVMDNGSVVESGTHQELMSQQGKYYQLYYESNKSAYTPFISNVAEA